MNETDFDAFGGNYRNIHNKNLQFTGYDSYYFARLKAEMIARQEVSGKGLKVLDIGCGDGVLLGFISQMISGADCAGVDESSISIQEAKANFPHLSFEIGNALALSKEDEAYDVVIMACVLHHVSEDQRIKALQEARRILKPSGRIYIFEHNPWNPVTRYLVRTCEFDKGVRLIYKKQLLKLLQGAGFQIKFQQFFLFFPTAGKRVFKSVEKKLASIPLGGQYLVIASK